MHDHLRPSQSRFADLDNPTPLIQSFCVGALLLLAVKLVFPEVAEAGPSKQVNSIEMGDRMESERLRNEAKKT